MFRKITTLLLLTLLAAIIFYIKPGYPSINFNDIDFAVSFDGPIQPGKQAEILLYAIKKTDLTPLSGKILSDAFKTKLETKNKNGIFKTLALAEEKIKTDSPLILSFAIAENLEGKKVWLNVYNDSIKNQLLFSRRIAIKPDRALILIPPETTPACGNFIKLNFHSFNLKTLAPEYQVPIRVRMQTPFKLFTINKVLNTDINGKATLKTLIHKNAMPGLYKFFLNFASRKITVSIPVCKNLVNASTKQSRKKQEIYFKTKSIPDYKIDFYNSGTSFFSALKAEKQMINFDFDCSGSSFRSIELWQKGKLIDQSYLPIEQGRSTYPLPRSTNLKIPLKIKLWTIKDKKIETDKKIIVIKPDKKLQEIYKNIQIKITNQKQFSEDQFLTNYADNHQHLYCDYPARNHGISSNSLYQISSVKDSKNFKHYEAIKSKRFDYFCKTDIHYNFASRFFVVKDDISLADYHFNNLLIHLSPISFLNSFIDSLPADKADITYLLSEAEARLLLMNYLNLAKQKRQAIYLESLVTPLSEILLILSNNKSRYQGIKNRLNKSLRYLKNYVHVPAKLEAGLQESSEDLPTLGPLKNIFDNKLSRSELNHYLQSSGKVFINKNNGSFQINLTGNIIKQANHGEIKDKNKIIKLINSRSTPIVIEISRATKQDDKVIH